MATGSEELQHAKVAKPSPYPSWECTLCGTSNDCEGPFFEEDLQRRLERANLHGRAVESARCRKENCDAVRAPHAPLLPAGATPERAKLRPAAAARSQSRTAPRGIGAGADAAGRRPARPGAFTVYASSCLSHQTVIGMKPNLDRQPDVSSNLVRGGNLFRNHLYGRRVEGAI